MSAARGLRRSSGPASALVALLVTSLVAPATFADESGTPQIRDSFSGDAIDPTVWWFGTNDPNAVAIWQADGRVTVGISGRAAPDFNAGLGTLCRARGNFDARIGFELTAWPAFDGIWVSLMAFDGSNLIGNVYRASASWGESYGAFYPLSGGTTVPAAGSRGALRLVRQGATMTGYYFAAHRWVAVFTGAVPVSDASFNLGVFNISAATPFGGDWATIQLDNFFVTADAVICS